MIYYDTSIALWASDFGRLNSCCWSPITQSAPKCLEGKPSPPVGQASESQISDTAKGGIGARSVDLYHSVWLVWNFRMHILPPSAWFCHIFFRWLGLRHRGSLQKDEAFDQRALGQAAGWNWCCGGHLGVPVWRAHLVQPLAWKVLGRARCHDGWC